MTLPEIVLPKIEIPFDIPVLLHPITVHFIIAVPVIILLLELMNLMMKKKAVGGVSFFLIILTVVAAVAAYLTGLNDGKEAFDALNEAAKSDLSAHKLLGTYVMLASGVVLVLKLLAMSGNKILKALYILVLIAFVALLFKQGEEGGELVYEHGLNVEKVQDLDDEIFDLKEELEEATPVIAVTPKVETKSEVKQVEAPVAPSTTEEVKAPIVEEAPVIEKETVVPEPASPVETTGIETVNPQTVESTQASSEQVVVIPSSEDVATPQQ